MAANSCDIAVVGGGAAGTMAAIAAAQLGKSVVLIERNDSIGKKILITGKGRCNLTNTAPIDEFIKSFGKQGEFLRSAFFAFFNEDLVEFFRESGLETKVERQGRVFPITDSARSVVETLRRRLDSSGVEVMCGSRLAEIHKEASGFRLHMESRDSMTASRVILSTGGGSYKATGSTGDGFVVAEKMKHNIAPLVPGLVPLCAKEPWVKDLQGLGLENVRITFEAGKRKLISEIGELMFTHFGVSGPLVLDMSSQALSIMKAASGELRLSIDLKPGMSAERLETRLLNVFKKHGKTQFKNIMKDFLPQRLIDLFVQLSGIGLMTEACQVTQKERKTVISLFKSLPLTITGSLPLEEAMVTGGGVSTKDINPRTMESRIVPGLYFAGEIIDGCAPSGGYNLQQAFSTGYLAGQSAAKSL